MPLNYSNYSSFFTEEYCSDFTSNSSCSWYSSDSNSTSVSFVYCCELCTEILVDDSEVFFKVDGRGINNKVCKECFKKSIICSVCHRLWVPEEESLNTKYNICKSCFEQLYVVCANCGKVEKKSKKRFIATHICKECLKKHFFVCKLCGYIYEKSNKFNFKGKKYCSVCYEKVKKLYGPEVSRKEIAEVIKIIDENLI